MKKKKNTRGVFGRTDASGRIDRPFPPKPFGRTDAWVEQTGFDGYPSFRQVRSVRPVGRFDQTAIWEAVDLFDQSIYSTYGPSV